MTYTPKLDWVGMWAFFAGMFTATAIAAIPATSTEQSWSMAGISFAATAACTLFVYLGYRASWNTDDSEA